MADVARRPALHRRRRPLQLLADRRPGTPRRPQLRRLHQQCFHVVRHEWALFAEVMNDVLSTQPDVGEGGDLSRGLTDQAQRARSTPDEPDQRPASRINARRARSTPGEPVPVRGRRIHYPTTFLNNVSTSLLNNVTQHRYSTTFLRPLTGTGSPGPARPDRLARAGSPGPETKTRCNNSSF